MEDCSLGRCDVQKWGDARLKTVKFPPLRVLWKLLYWISTRPAAR
jgi:hypothetical protein